MSEGTVTDHIVLELRRTNRLLVHMIIKEKNQTESMEILSKIGYQPKEIGELIGVARSTVSSELSKLRKKKKIKEIK